MLTNPSFECSAGVYDLPAAQGGVQRIPAGWTVTYLEGSPWLHSASMEFNQGHCGGGAHVEKMEGNDSLLIFAQDLEWSDRPGKPFDVAVHQQATVTPGRTYCLSAWLLSLCGGSTMPNDCPDGYYMAKLIGLDPAGGVNPLAPSVAWAEDRRNFVTRDGQRVGWVQMTVTAQAQGPTLTVFGRMRSPFQWHGNHGFLDAFKLVEAPILSLSAPGRVDGSTATVAWSGVQGSMIDSIPAGTFRLHFDVQVRRGADQPWQDWQTGVAAGQAVLDAQSDAQVTLDVRGRVRSEQPPEPAGSWPNHRFASLWSAPQAMVFNRPAAIFMPPPPVPLPPGEPAVQPQLNLAQKLTQLAAQKQVIQFNPGAALQKAIFAHGFVPNSGEFSVEWSGQSYAAQRAEHLGSGEVRVYFVKVGDWGNVQYVSGDGGGASRGLPSAPPVQQA